MIVMKKFSWPGLFLEDEQKSEKNFLEIEEETRKSEIEEILKLETMITKKEMDLEQSILVPQVF